MSDIRVSFEDALVRRLPYWRVNPTQFFSEAMGIDYLTEQQRIASENWGKLLACRLIKVQRQSGVKDEELHDSLKPFLPFYDEYHNKTGMSIMSCKGAGKDFLASLLAVHFMSTNPGIGNDSATKVTVTAPSQEQLQAVFFSEMAKNLNRTDKEGNPAFLFKNQFEKTTSKFYYKGAKETWFLTGRTAPKRNCDQQSGTLAGLHAEHMLVIYDEWTDVDDSVTNALQTTLTSPFNFALGLFNPKLRSGWAHRTHHDKEEKKNWIREQWSALDCPIVTPDQIKKWAKYGERSNLYRVNVLGLPPLSDESALIPWDWAMAATENEFEANTELPCILGVDPAGGGSDRYVGCMRQGGYVHGFKEFEGRKLAELTPEIMGYAKMYDAEYIVVDNTGGYGAGIIEMLEKYHPRVLGPAMSNTAFREEEYANVRAELFWRLRTAFEKGAIRIPYDEELIGELTCIKSANRVKGKLLIEAKKDIRDRLKGLSPDHADALALTYYVDDFANLDMHGEDDDDWEDDLNHSWMSA